MANELKNLSVPALSYPSIMCNDKNVQIIPKFPGKPKHTLN